MATETRQRRVYNPEACQLPTNTAPDPQFVSDTIRCQFDAPRNNSSRVAKKRDLNPNSPTYLRWLQTDGDYVTDINFGDYFLYDNDPVACPIAVVQHVNMYGSVMGNPASYITVTATRNGNTGNVTIDYDIEAEDGETDSLTGAWSTFIGPGKYESNQKLPFPPRNVIYYISNVSTATPGYTASGGGQIIGTPVGETGGGGPQA